VGIGFLPWLGFSIAQIQRISDYWPGTLRLDASIRTSLLQFVVGGGSGLQGLVLPAVLGVGLLLFGVLALLMWSSRRNFSQPAFFLLLYMLVPAALIFGVAYFRPKFDPRYLLVITPAFYLTLAWGIAAMLRPAVQADRGTLLRVLLPIVGIAALAGTWLYRRCMVSPPRSCTWGTAAAPPPTMATIAPSSPTWSPRPSPATPSC
jgi:4-amino-4-deoxy-L-arabinose transferase-like glycosyltransferase